MDVRTAGTADRPAGRTVARAGRPGAGGGPGVALLFPGQGAQQPGMAAGLYEADAAFRARLDEVFALWGAEGEELRRDWLAARPAVPLDDLRRSQPLLFAVGWALGRTVLDWGVRPAVLLGHSVGEVVAAVLAGVLTLPEGAALLADRVRHLAEAPPGGMVAVAASEEQVLPLLAPGVVVGAVNGPRQVVVAGAEDPLARTEQALLEGGLRFRRARTTSAFHSPVVAEAGARSLPLLRTTRLRPPQIPLVSGYTGDFLTDRQSVDPEFWSGQPAAQVRCADALDVLLASGPYVLVEAGPGQSLTMLAKRHRAVGPGGSTALALLPARPGAAAAESAALQAVRAAVAPA